MVRWDANDPLADVFLATFGAYPSEAEAGIDYDALFQMALRAQLVALAQHGVVPPLTYDAITPSSMPAVGLQPDHAGWGWDDPGFYYGDSREFTDLVNFWNLRASGIDLLFYDPAFQHRLREITDQHLSNIRPRLQDPNGWRTHVAVWNRSYDISTDLTPFGTEAVRCQASTTTWNGGNVKPPLMRFEDQSALGTASENGRFSLTFALPRKPFLDRPEYHTQKLIVSITPFVAAENVLLKPPYFPRLNEYLGREGYGNAREVRSELDGVGVVIPVTKSDLTLHALDVKDYTIAFFGAFGITAKPSPEGLVAARLIKQMGGLQGCRVFKIAGVRNLIGKYSPIQHFTRGAATGVLWNLDAKTGTSQFNQYGELWIDGKRVTTSGVFDHLLNRDVFRPGLSLKCPRCELEFWLQLDDVRSKSTCEYCGTEFSIAAQLKDRDWAYRRSGLFGRDDHQGGGVPVALTLQQIETALHGRLLLYATGTELTPAAAGIHKCEADFVVFAETCPERRLQVAIGECKAKGEITDEDVRNLTKVADALEAGNECQVFIVFAKTGTFTPAEVTRCSAAQGRYRLRVIMLSGRELEPYLMYELTGQEFIVPTTVISLEDMAQGTQCIYFEPRPKNQQPPGAVP
ncbi:MAG TPA: hypothetical protein VNF74_08985 [Terriglobales bacterium]|nr:hypothetical protein [Terriglobales bacterium]